MNPGDPVHVDFRKWPDTIHWQFTMRWLGEDEYGEWLWAPAGTEARRGADPPKRFGHRCVKVITRDRWWTAIFNDGNETRVYVDVATPAVWDGARVTMVDLDLDVVGSRDGSVTVEDEDEFLEHQLRLGYPRSLIDAARTATAEVVLEMERGDEPFGRIADDWLAEAATLDV